MLNRTLKVFITVCITAIIVHLIFSRYLPAQIEAISKAHPVANTESKRLKKQEGKKPESIAVKLGVPIPATKTHRTFGHSSSKRRHRKIFNVPEEIKTEVNFWKDVYTKYDKTKVVFHDKKFLDIIYSVIDISDIVNSTTLTDKQKAEHKSQRVETERDRIVAILKSLEDKDPFALNPEEKRIYHLFDRVFEPNKFKDAAASDRLRSQTGIADKFIEGIRIAGQYLGEIERIFSEHGIPVEITRLVFVESMFNLKAISKAGASGIWQFMPKTGRLFLNIDQIIDERNDPITATHGAARLLLKDYSSLDSWPLAINAYNTGRIRMERAAAQLKTKDISKIIKEFDYPGYGFASRNFYPAFLAVLSAFENREKHFGEIEMDEPLTYDIIQTPYFCTLPQIAKHTGTELEKLISLNPGLKKEVIEGDLPIPNRFSLRVPAKSGELFLAAMAEIEKTSKYAKWHIVEPGESLKKIAAKYSTTMVKIKQANRLRRNQVKTGQILKLPAHTALAKE